MSLFSDSESSNSSSDVVFGSLAVQPNSPTPYTDATQTKKELAAPHKASYERIHGVLSSRAEESDYRTA